MQHAGDDSGGYAELSGNGRKPNGKYSAHLDSGRGGLHVIKKGRKKDARQHRQIIFGMGAESGKAKCRQNRAHHGTGQIAADQHDISGAQNTYDPHIDQSSRRAVHQDEIRNRTTGMTHQLEEGMQPVPVHIQSEQQSRSKIQVQAGEQPGRASVTPYEYVVAFQPEGLQDTHHDKGEEPSGKSHVKKIVAHVHGGGMYGERRQHESGKDTDCYGDSKIGGKGEGQHVNKLRHHRRKAGAEERRIDIAAHACTVKSCVEPGSEQHGQDIHRIFAKKRKARVDKENRHGETGEGDFLQADQKDGKTQHQPRVKKGGAEPCKLKVIRDKGVPCKHDGNHATQKFFRRSQKKGGCKQEQGCCNAEDEHFPSFQHVSDFFSHRQSLP